MVDHLNAGHDFYLTDAKLTDAYNSILAILEAAEAPASFAFVGVHPRAHLFH